VDRRRVAGVRRRDGVFHAALERLVILLAGRLDDVVDRGPLEVGEDPLADRRRRVGHPGHRQGVDVADASGEDRDPERFGHLGRGPPALCGQEVRPRSGEGVHRLLARSVLELAPGRAEVFLEGLVGGLARAL
jgi:hypothetical protein